MPAIPTPRPTPLTADWSRVNGQAWTRAIKYGFVGLLLFWIWVPLLQGVGEGIGVGKADMPAFIFWVYVTACVVIGYMTSWNAEQKRVSSLSTIITPPPFAWTPLPRASWTKPSSATSSSSSPASQVVGSKIRSIYHRPTCEWVIKMSHRNRITFNSSSAAAARGYRACRVCRP